MHRVAHTRDRQRNRYGNDEARREGGSGIVPARIIPFDGMQTVPFASIGGRTSS